MQIVFFDYSDKILFVRDDIESGTWTQEEMSFNGLFPFNHDKRVTRGMRLGFTDSLGKFQLFEVRKVKTYEPDHYQEVTGESIAISELSNEFYRGGDILNKTPQQAVTTLITGTNWNIGNVTATNVSSANMSMGDVWNKIRIIEKNWNVLIIPRIEVGSNGITGRYLDIAPNDGTWRGLRLSLEKNADEVGVTIDDTDVLTALYGFGHTIEQTPTSATDEPPPLTFKDVVWQATSEHPAKPAGQEYIEDPTATALYGRNGRPRFGFYQNADITDANTLLQKTWESLRETNKPTVTIDCLVRDLYRMGYQDQPIRLHDKAIVEIRPTGEVYTLDVIKVAVDLLDPTATRVTIGHYIPNIIYIQRDTREKARGGGGGGGRGQTQAEYERQEYETEALRNAYNITFKASQNDLNTLDGVVQQAVVDISAQGVTISQIDNRVTSTEASISVMSGQIQTKVSAGDIASTINQTAQSVLIQASKINLEGYVTADYLAANTITVHGLTVSNGGCNLGNSNIYVNGQSLLLGVRSLTVTPSGNDVTIAWSDYSNTAHSVTFSKAATIIGTWTGGTFNVSATSGTITAPVSTTIGMTAGGQGTSFSVSAYADGDETKTVATQNLVLSNETSSSQVHVGSSSGKLVASLSYPFTLASVTLQGQPISITPLGSSNIHLGASDVTAYPVVTSGGTNYYQAGTNLTLYPAGSSFTVQGSTGPKLYHRGKGQLYTLDGTTYKKIGDANTDWYYVSSIGTQYYNAGTSTRTAIGTGQTITPISSTTKIVLGTSGTYREHLSSGGTTYFTAGTQGTYYEAGETVANTYYTRN